MKKFLADFIKRLSSRKFIVTLGAIAAVITFPDQAGDIVTLTVAFVGAEGIGDAAERYQTQKTTQAETQLKAIQTEQGMLDIPMDVDRSQVVPGSAL